MKQRSILREVTAKGKAVHTGEEVTLTIKPAPEDYGVVFRRVDLYGKPEVKAVRTTNGEIPCDVVVLAAGVGTTQLATMLGIDLPQQDSPGVVVRTDPRPPLFKTIAVLNTPPLDATD